MESNGLDLDTDNDLAAAFATREAKQEDAGGSQDGDEGVESQPTILEDSSGTTPSREDSPPKDSDPLAGLTVEQVLAHPELGRKFQSWKDQEAAKQISSATTRARADERKQVELELTRAHFDGLEDSELLEELKDPQIKARWQELQALPPPPPPEQVNAAVAFYARQLKVVSDEIANSDLPPDVKASLDPSLHILQQNGDPDEIMLTWQSLVHKSITDHAIAKATGKAPGPKKEAEELDRQAAEDEGSISGTLLETGRRTPALPDFDKTSGDSLLEDAFARTDVNRRRTPVR